MEAPESTLRYRVRHLGAMLLYAWIFGTAFFFFLRFSLEVLQANPGPVRQFLQGLST